MADGGPGQVLDDDALRHGPGWRMFFGEVAVDEHQFMTIHAGETKAVYSVPADPVADIVRHDKVSAGDGSHVGIFPVFLAQAGKAFFLEPLNAGVADSFEPVARQLSAEAPGFLQIMIDCRHAHAAASSHFTQSYPCSSSCTANWRSPDLTIRPSDNTCTRSGMM